MEVKYTRSYLDEKVDFRFDGWLQVRRDNIKCTSVFWTINNKMMFDDGIYNSRTPIILFLN